ncbi:MAG: hypothetical protein KF893_07500 [Caldilineaceae bacterium]|nr:hypothetical protein [Caldilineaceae bacterium]
MTNQPWSERWLDLLSQLGYEPHLRRGRSYARRGQVKALEVQVGRVTAQIEDRDTGLCEIEILMNRLTDPQWQGVFDALNRQAIYVAQLLAGDMPTNIDELFQQAGVNLMPGGRYDMEIRCNQCQDIGQPCKHAAAVLYLLGQMLDDDPWLLFRLRGRDRQQVLQALRQRRSEKDDSGAVLPAQPINEPHPLGSLGRPGETGVPLAAQLENFWGSPKRLSQLHHHIAPPPIKLALLRRLGHPPFPVESIETYDRLAQIYHKVTEKALDLAYAPEPEEE